MRRMSGRHAAERRSYRDFIHRVLRHFFITLILLDILYAGSSFFIDVSKYNTLFFTTIIVLITTLFGIVVGTHISISINEEEKKRKEQRLSEIRPILAQNLSSLSSILHNLVTCDQPQSRTDPAIPLYRRHPEQLENLKLAHTHIKNIDPDNNPYPQMLSHFRNILMSHTLVNSAYLKPELVTLINRISKRLDSISIGIMMDWETVQEDVINIHKDLRVIDQERYLNLHMF